MKPARAPVAPSAAPSVRTAENAPAPQSGTIGAINSIHAAWLTAQQIADLRLEGLPTTVRGVISRANAEGWQWKPRMGRGGGRLYAADALPEAARADLVWRRADAVTVAARPAGRPSGSDFFTRNPAVADAVKVILSEYRHPSETVMKMLATRFVTLPSLRTLRRFIQRCEDDNRVLFTMTRDPDRAKSRYRMALGRMDATVTCAHQMWEIDTTKADLICTDGRKNILGIIDRWSRRARFLVVDSESAQSVRRMLVTTIIAWGVMPQVLKVDNGSGFINASLGTALDILGIALDVCLPGHPEDKPHVERLFGTFNRQRAPLLKGFSGHNVAQAQKLRAKAKKEKGRAVIEAGIDSAELQRILDAWTDGEYHQRTHSSLGMSPMEKWRRSPEPARAAPSPALLKIALSAYVGVATVGKRGVRWSNGRYWSAALAPWLDRQVVLRRDEDDLGALFVFDLDGNFIDTAVNHERAGVSQQQFAMAARQHVGAHLAKQKAELRNSKKGFSIEKAIDRMLRDEAEAAGRLAHFPMPTRADATPAMDSIGHAVAPAACAPAAPAKPAITATAISPTAQSPAEKVAQADAVIDAASRGEAVDPDMLARARLYVGTSEYRAQKIVDGHFAPRPTAPDARRGAA